jgi:hypothetical protein
MHVHFYEQSLSPVTENTKIIGRQITMLWSIIITDGLSININISDFLKGDNW